MCERWVRIPGWPLYEASSLGRIRNSETKRVRKLTPIPTTEYLGVSLHSGARSGYAARWKQTTCRVHVLVCSAFHGERPEGMQVAHNNGIRTDNRPENLRWDTAAGNAADRKSHGTNGRGGVRGESNHNAKLTAAKVREIIFLRASGMKRRTLAMIFGVSERTIQKICNGRSWKSEIVQKPET